MGEIIFIAFVVVVGIFIAGHRRTALALGAIVLAVGIGVYYSEQHQDKEVTSRITPAEVAIQDVTFVHTFRSSYDLRGKLTNKSENYAIDRIGFNVKLKDCVAATCTQIGTTTAYAAVRVLPHETHDFTASMYVGSEDIKPKGNLAWEYEIAAIFAKKP